MKLALLGRSGGACPRPANRSGGACPRPANRSGGACPRPGGRKALPYVICAAAALLLISSLATAQSGLPKELEQVGLDQRIGERVPLELRLTDHEGTESSLADYFTGLPVILVPVYYDCPMLCTMVLEGLVRSLKGVSLEPGRDFRVVAVSFDPREGSENAGRRHAITVERLGRPEAAAGFHFLTGDEAAVAALMDAIGFRYRFDPETGEFAHPSTVIVVTPDGVVARYFLGVEYPPRDLRLSLVEAADERIGGVVDQVLLYCFKYDPTSGRYTAATMNLIRAGGLITLALMGGFVMLSLKREKRRREAAGARI